MKTRIDKWASFISWLRIERSLVVVVFRHVTVEVNGDILVFSGGLVDEEEVGLLSIAENITKNDKARHSVVSESVG